MPKKPQKLFVVRKYIKASSASEAIKKDKTTAVDEVDIDEEWRVRQFRQVNEKPSAIGFDAQFDDDEEEYEE